MAGKPERERFYMSGRPDLFDKNQREGIDKLFPVFFGFCMLLGLALAGLFFWAVVRLIVHFT